MSLANRAIGNRVRTCILLLWCLPLPLSCRTANSTDCGKVVETSTASAQTRSRGAHLPSTASDNLTNTFRSSLEMKENVDFLLTPAILVQQAMQDDAIVIYPSE